MPARARPCPTCGGSGQELRSVPMIDRPGTKGVYRTCRDCGGTGTQP